MGDQQRTKADLIRELESLRGRVRELEAVPGTPPRPASDFWALCNGLLLDSRHFAFALCGERLVWMSDSARQRLGYGSDEPAALPTPADLFSDELTALVNDRSLPLDTRSGSLLTLAGDRAPVEARLCPLPELPEGCRLLLARDLGSRLRARHALQESEERFTQFFQRLPDGVLVVDLATREFLDANEAICQMTGYSHGELCRMRVDDLHPPDVLDAIRAAFSDPTGQLLTRILDLPFRRKDGSALLASAHAVPLTLAGRRCVAGVFRDVTERRKQDEALRQSESRLKATLDHADILVFLLDRDGLVVSIEGKATRTHGLDLTAFIGRSTLACYAERPDIVAIIRQALAGQPGQFTSNHLGRTFDCHLNPVLDETGTVTGVVVVGIDMTDRLASEHSLRESEERFSLATQSAGIGVWHWDMGTGRITWDKRMCALYGIAPEQTDLDYATWQACMHPDDVAETQREVAEALAGNHEFHTSFRVVHSGGSVRHVEAHALVRRDEHGTPLSMTGVNWDITELMLANRRLRESQDSYQQLFTAMLEGFALHEIILDRDGTPCDYRFLEVNPAFEELTGLRAETTIGHTVRELMPDNEPEWLARYGEVALTGIPTRFEQFSAPLGKHFDVAAYSPIRGQFACIFRDVTERRRNESRVRTETRVLEALNSPDTQRAVIRQLLAIIQEETGMEAVGLRLREGDDYPYYEQRGFSRDFLATEGSLCVRQDDETTHLACICGRVLQGGCDPALSFFTGNGSFWTNSVSVLLSTPEHERLGILRGRCPRDGYESLALIPLKCSGEVIGLLQLNDHRRNCFTPEDIVFYEGLGASIGVSVARERDQAALRRNEGRLHHILDSLGAGVIAVDRETDRVAYANPAAAALLGRSRESLVGLAAGELSTALDDETASGEAKLLAADGHRVPVLRTSSLAELGDRRCQLHSFLDLTAIQEAEEQRQRFQERLDQAQRLEAIGTLAGGIAHDFNNILYAILGFSELALDDCPPESDLRENVREAMKAANRAKELVGQILLFSRQTEQEKMPFRLQSAVRDVAKLLRGTIPAAIGIQTDLDPGCPCVQADPNQMHQILMNLCTNSYQAMRRQAEFHGESGRECLIRLQLRQHDLSPAETQRYPNLLPGPYAELTVADTGPGIPADIVDHIFEPYFTTKTKERGTGLGLAIVEGIVRAHGGAVTVESEFGVGTTFRVLLPVCAGEGSESGDEDQSAAPSPANDRVLLVDDEDPIRHLAQVGLARHGYRVTVASEGKMALEMLYQDPQAFDVLVTDLSMPGMSGMELAWEALRLRPDLPVVLCTGFSETITQEEAHARGIREMVMKPLPPSQLAELIGRVLHPPA